MYGQLYRQVLEWIPEKSRVLDLGTGDGAFLEQLVKTKQVNAEGVERNAELVTRCISRGVVVHQGEIMDGLDQYGPQAFDYILLLGTLQELIDPPKVIQEAFRVGRRIIVSYSNFAHFRVRLQMMFTGRSPVTKSLPSPWYRTANTRFFSVLDFHEFCRDMRMREMRSAYFNHQRKVQCWPNLRAEIGVSMLESEDVAAKPSGAE
jgi:methionine biosynthesis protein MetW